MARAEIAPLSKITITSAKKIMIMQLISIVEKVGEFLFYLTKPKP